MQTQADPTVRTWVRFSHKTAWHISISREDALALDVTACNTKGFYRNDPAHRQEAVFPRPGLVCQACLEAIRA